MMAEKIKLSLGEKIQRAKEGRSQRWIIQQMVKKGFKINDVQFSRKKWDDTFSPKELAALSEILSTDLTK